MLTAFRICLTIRRSPMQETVLLRQARRMAAVHFFTTVSFIMNRTHLTLLLRMMQVTLGTKCPQTILQTVCRLRHLTAMHLDFRICPMIPPTPLAVTELLKQVRLTEIPFYITVRALQNRKVLIRPLQTLTETVGIKCPQKQSETAAFQHRPLLETSLKAIIRHSVIYHLRLRMFPSPVWRKKRYSPRQETVLLWQTRLQIAIHSGITVQSMTNRTHPIQPFNLQTA